MILLLQFALHQVFLASERVSYFYIYNLLIMFGPLITEIRIARIFNTYGPRMNIDDGRVVSNFIAQALR